jgi:uncharacterized protein
VRTADLSRAQAQLAKTLAVRSMPPLALALRFSPSVDAMDSWPLPEPVFFENKQYAFEIEFKAAAGVDLRVQPKILHRLASVEAGFYFKRETLFGSISTGNDVGWFRLGFSFSVAGKLHTQYVSFEVLPTKLAMQHDLQQVHLAIDAIYPLWRFSFLQKTDVGFNRGRRPQPSFELLWLAQFASLRTALNHAVRVICNEPHARLMPSTTQRRLGRLRGALPAKLERLVDQHLALNETHRHYAVTKRTLAVDTPENRFVKMVLSHASRRITAFSVAAKLHDQSPDKERLSASFFTELSNWQKPLNELHAHPMFESVGAYQDTAQESLVLQQRAGYAAVYRIWQELKLYLELFGAQAFVSVKSVAELYEVWCFLEIRRQLLLLQFTETKLAVQNLKTVGFEKAMEDGLGAAFTFRRSDGVTLRLAHEPGFGRREPPKVGHIYSWTTYQKPDILLEATFESTGETIRWIFDAKYRLDNKDANGLQLAPEDAINQMHRYRDALIYMDKAHLLGEPPRKTRPVVGAFVLYPAVADEPGGKNPYQRSIDDVGIGAFPALPGQPNEWLAAFLRSRLPVPAAAQRSLGVSEYSSPDAYFVESPLRIAPTGTSIERHRDLTLVASLGDNTVRSAGYFTQFESGNAPWYHMPLATTVLRSVGIEVMQQVRFCALAVRHGSEAHKCIKYVYEVKSIRLAPRNSLDLLQAGSISTKTADYWLFELGSSVALAQPIQITDDDAHFKLKTTDLPSLKKGLPWGQLPAWFKGSV